MDEPGLAPDILTRALDDLDRINRVTRTAPRLTTAIARLAPGDHSAPLTVHDYGCGGGGVTAALARGLLRLGVNASVTGLDANPTAVARARDRWCRPDASPAGASDLRFDHLVVGTDPLPAADIAASSLFLHHLQDDALDAFLGNLAETVRIGVVLDDLVRSRSALGLTWLGTRIISRCDVVHSDGPQSVRAALTPRELLMRARAAGMTTAVVRRTGPLRMMLIWRRS